MNTGDASVSVWPLAIRVGHGLLAASVVICGVTHEGGSTHERFGYVAGVVALWRVWVGLTSRRSHIAFSGFVRGPRATWAHVRQLLSRSEHRHLGHNPLGAWMVVALLTLAVAAGASGALYVTDRFWGEAWVIAMHALTGWALLALLPLHLAGVALTSWLQRENLVAAMLHGRKRAARADDTP